MGAYAPLLRQRAMAQSQFIGALAIGTLLLTQKITVPVLP